MLLFTRYLWCIIIEELFYSPCFNLPCFLFIRSMSQNVSSFKCIFNKFHAFYYIGYILKETYNIPFSFSTTIVETWLHYIIYYLYLWLDDYKFSFSYLYMFLCITDWQKNYILHWANNNNMHIRNIGEKHSLLTYINQ